VPERASELPRCAAFGVDFSLFSQRAAKAALALMQVPWEAHLVHVMSGMEFLPTFSEGWRDDFEDELRSRLEDFGAGLSPTGGSQVHAHILEGEPARELLAFSEGKGLELLVAGSHGLSFIGRILMGSVSTRLIRGSRIPVLIVPPLERSEAVLPEPESDRPAHPWVQELKDFTRANAGRRTTMEVMDPELGAQECGRNLPLWGVDFDPAQDRIHIMLGRSGTVDGHLTHTISAPRELQVVRGEDGRTEALHVRLEGGQVILRIVRD
jgi:nucleotide-binding universal stress UspA family protein